MADETEADYDARQVDEARLAAARWAVELVDEHRELLDLIPADRRHLYTGRPNE